MVSQISLKTFGALFMQPCYCDSHTRCQLVTTTPSSNSPTPLLFSKPCLYLILFWSVGSASLLLYQKWFLPSQFSGQCFFPGRSLNSQHFRAMGMLETAYIFTLLLDTHNRAGSSVMFQSSISSLYTWFQPFSFPKV